MLNIRVLIADDHALVREGIGAVLKAASDIEVVGYASDGIEAIEKVRKLVPDILLLDIAMPRLGGLEVTLELQKTDPDVRILILTQYDDNEYVSRFLKAGVSGFLLKKAVGSELVSAIRAVNRGELYLYPSIANEVVAGYLGKQGGTSCDTLYDRLTDREKQVLRLIAEGYTHREIAGMLDISAKTVVAHQTNVGEKLGLRSKAEIIKFAISNHIIKL